MDSWEDEEVEAVGLKANWDDSDEEEDIPIKEPVSQPTKPTPTSLPPKKKSLSQKIAEREAEEQKRKQQADSPKETEAQRKEREQQLIIESDLENAKELFAATSIKNSNTSSLFDSQPRTRAEFEKYSDFLMVKMNQLQSQTQYSYFVETLVRELCNSLSLDDTRKISTVISAQINEKQKAFSNKKKKGATKKAQLAKSASAEENFELYEGEYDDFM